MGISTYGQEKMPSISQEYLGFLRVGFVMNSIPGTRGLTKIELQVSKNGVPMVRIKKMPKYTNSILACSEDVWIGFVITILSITIISKSAMI